MENRNQTQEFTTANMRIEQFLFAHRIRYKRLYKNDDMMTVWVYDRTPDLERIVAEYRSIWEKGVA